MTEVCLIVEDVHGHWIEHSHFGGTASMKLAQLPEWLRELDSTYEDDAPRWRITTSCPDDQLRDPVGCRDGRCLDCGCCVEWCDKGCLNQVCENFEQPEDATRVCRFVPMDMLG